MAEDPLANRPVIETSPILTWYPITPDDNANLPRRYRQIKATGAGNVAAVQENGPDVTMPFAAGETMDWRPLRIKSTDTTATGLFGGL